MAAAMPRNTALVGHRLEVQGSGELHIEPRRVRKRAAPGEPVGIVRRRPGTEYEGIDGIHRVDCRSPK